MAKIRSYSHRTTNKKVFEMLAARPLDQQKIVDVGAGEGYFSQMLGEHLKHVYSIEPAAVLRACDLYPEEFKYADVPCDKIDAELKLPYDNDSFDAVCSIEVVEHLENQFHFVRELFRVVKPGGKVIVTTPNILNINSRIRFMHSGFGLLYDPLPLKQREPARLMGHIHPISFYYLCYIFHSIGFQSVRVHFDRRKKSAIFLTAALYIPLVLKHFAFRSRLRRKNKAIYYENKALISQTNSFDMLTSRTVIVEGIK